MSLKELAKNNICFGENSFMRTFVADTFRISETNLSEITEYF